MLLDSFCLELTIAIPSEKFSTELRDHRIPESLELEEISGDDLV